MNEIYTITDNLDIEQSTDEYEHCHDHDWDFAMRHLHHVLRVEIEEIRKKGQRFAGIIDGTVAFETSYASASYDVRLFREDIKSLIGPEHSETRSVMFFTNDTLNEDRDTLKAFGIEYPEWFLSVFQKLLDRFGEGPEQACSFRI